MAANDVMKAIKKEPRTSHAPKGERKIIKNTEAPIQRWRRLVQFGFLALIVWIGVEFVLFVNALENGSQPIVTRPPGVEGFLPISALIGLKYWVLTGIFNTIHPSAMVILLIVLVLAFWLKKSFCSWICPFGLLSEFLEKIHVKLFDRSLKLPRWLDYPLRSLKYLLLLFFLWAILVKMNIPQLERFIYSPYNKVADIKMLHFFANMSDATLWTLTLLVLLSIVVPYFWCRYLCPYGALVALIGFISPFKIRRNPVSCTDCEKCSRVCPAHIAVHRVQTVHSDECHVCLRCVDACPVKDTLYLAEPSGRWRLPKKLVPVLIVGVFLLGTLIARISGRWQNSIPQDEYFYHMQHINEYYHNRGQVSDYEPVPRKSELENRNKIVKERQP